MSHKRLYLIHCGFYPDGGIYESHTNLFVVASSFEEARILAKALPEFQAKKMHVDGMQEILAVTGHRVRLAEDLSLAGGAIVVSRSQRELAKSLDAQLK